MKTLRNILLLFAYIFGIIGLGVILFLQIKFLPLSVLALALVVISYFLVKTERRHARAPFAIAVLGIVMAFLIPVIFPAEVAVDDTELAETAEKDAQEIDEMLLGVDETSDYSGEETADSSGELSEDLPGQDLADETTGNAAIAPKTPKIIITEEMKNEGLAAPVIVD